MKLKKNYPGIILIRVRPSQTQVIQKEKDEILSYCIYPSSTPYLSGYIYKGKVAKILPGIGACFVDIGLDKEVFLHNKEVISDETQIQKKLKKGQMILVQVIKTAIGSKSARVSMKISLAGSKLVYLPYEPSGAGVSKKITDEKERERLETELEKLKPKGKVIVRTKAVGESHFKRELGHLYKLWSQIKNDKRKTKGLVFSDIPPALQILRDGLSSQNIQVWVDDKEIYNQACQFVKKFLPEFKNQVHYYKEKTNLFEKFNVIKKTKQAFNRKVYLKSGGAIVIDENEAMVVIDVNTGRFVGKDSQEKTVLNTNLEAVKVIAEQIRVRNLGGIIVIDFIDMEESVSKDKLLEQLQKELEKDPVYTEIVSVSSLNLVQITRKRVRPSLRGLMCEVCPSCEGSGVLKSAQAVAIEIFNESVCLYDERKKKNVSQKMEVLCHPVVSDWIQDQETAYLDFLSEKYKIQLLFKPDHNFHQEEFEVRP